MAPGGVGKSSNSVVEALAMASGRPLLGEWVGAPLRVWLCNLEDPADELQRRVTAAMLHHGIAPAEIEGRLFVDGRERELLTAIQDRGGVRLDETQYLAMEAELRARAIDVLIVDPLVSTHLVDENSNSAMDRVFKGFWAPLAARCAIAVELVHHTRKLGGEAGSSESARGASALLAAARSGRVLNRMSKEERDRAGIGETDTASYFSVQRDKANLAPEGKRAWRRVVSVELANGDNVGVVEAWDWPDDFDGLSAGDLLRVQKAIDGAAEPLRYSDQSSPWVGEVVAEVLGLDAATDRKRIRRMIEQWLQSGALQKINVTDGGRKSRPCVQVGEWASG